MLIKMNNKSTLYNITKGVKEFGQEVFNSRTLYLFAAPLVIPTASGEFIRTIKNYKNLSGAQKAGAITSLVVGGALGIFSIASTIYTAEDFDLEKVIYPMAGITNIISGISEIGSAIKNKISNLESKLEK